MNLKNTLLLLFSSVLLSSCSEPVEEDNIVRTVRAIKLVPQFSDTQRSFNGQAQTDRVINLSFRSTGMITLFNIKLGQQVAKGDLLAELDDVAARLSYEQAIASLNSAKSNLDTQQLALSRVQTLYERGGASLSDYENAKNSFRNAQASHRSAQRSVEIQQEQIRYGKIFAPEDGVISAVNKEVEETAAAGETVAVLNAGTAMEIEVGLPESVINQVDKSTQASITFAALPQQLFQGKITEVSPSINSQTGTYPVRVLVEEATNEVRSGMAATVRFDFTDGQDVDLGLVIPANAVGEDANGRFAFIVEQVEEQRWLARKKTIEVGELVGNSFEIVNGLTEGDTIITAGVHSVLDGQEVRLQ